MLDASDRVMAAGIVDVRLLTVVRVSSSSDRCLIVSHQVCKVVTCDRKKLTMVERCRSNHCVNNSVNVFRFMQERKYVCGEQPKIRILQHLYYSSKFFHAPVLFFAHFLSSPSPGH